MRNSVGCCPPPPPRGEGVWGRQAASARDMPENTSGSEGAALPASDGGAACRLGGKPGRGGGGETASVFSCRDSGGQGTHVVAARPIAWAIGKQKPQNWCPGCLGSGPWDSPPRQQLRTVANSAQPATTAGGFPHKSTPPPPPTTTICARVPLLSPNDHPNPSQERQEYLPRASPPLGWVSVVIW